MPNERNPMLPTVSRETLDTLIWLALLYVAAGALVWCFFVNTGIVRASFLDENSRARHGIPAVRRMTVRRTLHVIVAWPWFVPLISRKAVFQAKRLGAKLRVKARRVRA